MHHKGRTGTDLVTWCIFSHCTTIMFWRVVISFIYLLCCTKKPHLADLQVGLKTLCGSSHVLCGAKQMRMWPFLFLGWAFTYTPPLFGSVPIRLLPRSFTPTNKNPEDLLPVHRVRIMTVLLTCVMSGPSDEQTTFLSDGVPAPVYGNTAVCVVSHWTC